MFVRVTWADNRGYLQLVESFRKGGVSNQRLLYSLGRCDEKRYHEVRELIRDYEPLERAGVVVEELEEVSGPLQRKGFFRKFRTWR